MPGFPVRDEGPRVETSFEGTVTLEKRINCQCPVDGTMDRYDLTLELVPHYDTIELRFWNNILDNLSKEEYTQEDLTEHIAEDLLLTWFGEDSIEFELTLVGDHYGTKTTTTRSHP